MRATMPPNYWIHWAGFCWLIFLGYWFISARKLKAVKQREPLPERLKQIIAMAIAYSLMFNDALGSSRIARRFVPVSDTLGEIGLAATIAGVAMAIWARWHLGENWSATVTLKEEHELIGSGPYRRIRHPIYTGMLVAFAGTALALGQVRGLMAFAVVVIAFYMKARKEERFLAQEFGERFREHQRRTGMFLPKLT